MVLVGIVVVLYAVIFLTDFIPYFKTTGTKDKIVYGSFMLVSFVVLILYSLGIKVPSPTTPIKDAIDAILPK